MSSNSSTHNIHTINNNLGPEDKYEFTYDDQPFNRNDVDHLNFSQNFELKPECSQNKYEISEQSMVQSTNGDDLMPMEQSIKLDSNSQLHDQQNNDDDEGLKSKNNPSKYKGRKSKEQMKLLISYYHLYDGAWDEKNFFELVQKTGFTKKQLNKWFWDRKKKENDALAAK